MISQFFVLSPRGDVILRRDYLGNVPKVRGAAGAPAGAARSSCGACRAAHDRGPAPPRSCRPHRPRGALPYPCLCTQASTEIFFRNAKFYKEGDEAPPVFLIDGVTYLHVKVGFWVGEVYACGGSLCRVPINGMAGASSLPQWVGCSSQRIPRADA